jgi:hypothetical protein
MELSLVTHRPVMNRCRTSAMWVVRRSSNLNMYIDSNLSHASRISSIKVSLIWRPFFRVLVRATAYNHIISRRFGLMGPPQAEQASWIRAHLFSRAYSSASRLVPRWEELGGAQRRPRRAY